MSTAPASCTTLLSTPAVRADFPFRPASLPFFYGWVVLVISTLGVLSSIPGQTMGVSVFTDALLEATGLSRLAFSNAYLTGTLISGLALTLGGGWLDRFGVRITVFGACLGLAATLCFLAQADRLARWLAAAIEADDAAPVAWVLLALGFTALRFMGQGMLTLASRTTLARWFVRRRGLVAAISGAFVSFGFAAAPLGLDFWIGAAGWRGAWQGMAIMLGLGMGLVGLLFLRDTPEECGLRPDGDPALADDASEAALIAERAAAEREFTRPEAMRTGAFWLVSLGLATHAMVGTGLTFHIVDLGAEAGLARAGAVAIFLPIAVLATPVGFLAGAALDRLPVRLLMLAMMLSEVVMYAGMAFWSIPVAGWLGVLGWGLSSGCFGPLSAAAMPAYFGRRHLGAIQSAQMASLVIGSALGPAVLAAFRDVFGTYRPGLLMLCVVPLMIAAAAPFTRTPVRDAARDAARA